MPELPEVETTRRGIAPHLEGQRVSRVVVRERRLRWPIPEDLDVRLSGQRIVLVERRAKYLLINAEVGTLISHLGMSGNLRLVEVGLPAAKHEHVDIELESGLALRYTDPRRFGAMLWSLDPYNHELLIRLGPEPLTELFDGGEAVHHGQRGGGGRGQYLRDGSAVRGGDRSAPRGRWHFTRALFEAGDRDQTHAGGRHRTRRHHVARLHWWRWAAGVFPAGAVRLRPRGRGVQGLRERVAQCGAGAAGECVLPEVSELTVV